ncbi:MAG: ankyrin repeat domain-containing protein [Acidobacteriia bacterium]|nr:ankyrin repeat domain-containing protein [Terriglobia bacterium]
MRTLAILLLACGIASAQIADAVEHRDSDAVQALLKQHANVNATQPDGTTALHWAAHWNDLAAVKLLLGAGANPKIANRYGATPLSEAATQGNAAMIEALLKAGADPKTLTTADGETVLMTAARAGNVDAVKILLDRGADINARENYKGQTALMWAAAERHPEVVKLLMARGADWKVRSFDRPTKLPKLSAASSVSPMARGGFTAFLFVAREGDIESAKAMLDGGVDINQADVDGATALVVSIMNKKYTFAKFLLDRGANPNLADDKGRGALYAAVDMRNENYSALPNRKEDDPMPSLEIVKALLAHGANPNLALLKSLPGRSGMDSGDTGLGEGATPLIRAALSGDSAVMRALLQKGADPKLTLKDGSTALMVAAGVNYRDKFTRGTEADALEALKVALETGLSLDQVNTRGETALHGAAGRGADSIVQFLVDHGAKLDTKTKTGYTALDYAMGKNVFGQLPVPHDNTVDLIKKLGGREGKDIQVASK